MRPRSTGWTKSQSQELCLVSEGSISGVVNGAATGQNAPVRPSRRTALAGMLSVGALGLSGCDGFFISATTTTTLTSSATNATLGASITLTAKVVNTAATGTVTFYDGTTQLGTGTITSGVATYATVSLTNGTHTLTAVYSGDTTFNTSTSAAITVVVSAALTASTTTLASSTPGTTFGMSVLFTATVSPSAATGTVQFFDSTTTLGSGVIIAGAASFATTTLAVGAHTVTATYVGDSNYATSTSGAVTVTIT